MRSSVPTSFLDVLLLCLAITWSLAHDEQANQQGAEDKANGPPPESQQPASTVQRPELVVLQRGGQLFFDDAPDCPISPDAAIRRAKQENRTLVIGPEASSAFDLAAELKRDGTVPFKLRF